MATKEQRGESWRVYWRLGGRGGAKQSTTWQTEARANQAKQIAEAHKHKITADEVYAAVTGKKIVKPVVETRPLLPTVAEWADEWLRARTRIGPRQRRTYRRQLDNEILPCIGHLHLDEVTGITIAGLLNELRATRKDSTVTRYYALLHSLFRYAVIEGKIGDNPAKRTDWVRDLVSHDDVGDDRHVYLTRDEYGMLRDAADPRARPLIETLADTGARFAEATALDVRDVRLAGTPGVWITKSWKTDEEGRWYRGATKGRNRRFVALPRRTVEVLRPLTTGRPGTALLFVAPMGGQILHSNWVPRFWAPAVAKAGRCVLHPPPDSGTQVERAELSGPRCGDNGGVDRRRKSCRAWVKPGWNRCPAHIDTSPLASSTCDCDTRLKRSPTPHDLRHSHVAWLIAASRPIVVISRRIGHHSTTITERVYGGILPQVDAETVAALDAFDEIPVEEVEVARTRRRVRHPQPVARRVRRRVV